MDMHAKVNTMTRFFALALGWLGKAAILFLLIAVLGFTQNLYGIDVHLSPDRPMVQVHVVLFDGMPRVSWRKLVNFTNGLFHSSGYEQACRESEKRKIG